MQGMKNTVFVAKLPLKGLIHERKVHRRIAPI